MQEPTTKMLKCPKCPGTMRTYERMGIQIEQCDTCRGIFLDFGELEALTRLETQYQAPPQQYQAPPPQYQAPPPQYAQPGWGGPGYHHGHYRKHGWGGLFFSS
jgi:Zn-finger nucleic acid-binding protein